MDSVPEIAAWLITRRPQIEEVMVSHLGPAAPSARASETEALRRFRSYAASSLQRGMSGEPALDGMHVNERRVVALVSAWCDAAAEVAGEHSETVRKALEPLFVSFRNALRTTNLGRRKSGAPRTSRRAVTAAIDRVSDVFLAVDADSGRVVDANPAAGALLGVARDALIDVEVMSFVPAESRERWSTHLDAVTEDSEPRRFTAELADKDGTPILVDCAITRFATRSRTLALLVARPGS